MKLRNLHDKLFFLTGQTAPVISIWSFFTSHNNLKMHPNFFLYSLCTYSKCQKAFTVWRNNRTQPISVVNSYCTSTREWKLRLSPWVQSQRAVARSGKQSTHQGSMIPRWLHFYLFVLAVYGGYTSTEEERKWAREWESERARVFLSFMSVLVSVF